MQSDGELLAAWQAGDRAAGEALFERYYAVLVRFFANEIGGDPMDLVQETFIGCVSGESRLRDRQGFRAFLFGIAFNQLKKHYERQRRHGERFDPATHTAADLSPGPGTMLTKSREQQLLLDALRRLPVRYQVVLELFYWEFKNPGDPNPATRRAFGSKPTGSNGVRHWFRVLPSSRVRPVTPALWSRWSRPGGGDVATLGGGSHGRPWGRVTARRAQDTGQGRPRGWASPWDAVGLPTVGGRGTPGGWERPYEGGSPACYARPV